MSSQRVASPAAGPIAGRLVSVSGVGAFDAQADALYALFGVGNLLAGYSGAFERWRRATDNDQQDVWWDGSTVRLGGGEAVTDWLASGNAYQVTRYDHTRQGHDATQATTSAQPRTALAGVVDVGPNGKPAAVYSGAQFLEIQNARGFVRNASAITVAANAKATAAPGGVFWSPRNVDTFSRQVVVFSTTTTLNHQARSDDNAALPTAIKTVTASAWVRIIARARFAAGSLDLVTDGGPASAGVISPAQASANTDAFQAPRIGAGASGFITGQIGTVVLARAALDPALTDTALLRVAS
jgi:hypothetical protein